MNESPIYTAIRLLIDDGRLTGVTPALAFEGVPFMAADDDRIDEPGGVEYDADGFSIQRSEWGGRMCRDVEAVREKLLAGGEHEQIAAAKLPQWFCRVADLDENTDPRADYTVRRNNDVKWMEVAFGGGDPRRIELMREYSAEYRRVGTHEPVWGFQSGPGLEYVRPYPGAYIGNHRICVARLGDAWTAAELGAWAAARPVGPTVGWVPPGG